MNGTIFPPIPTPSSTDDDLLPSDIICAGSDDECNDNAEAKRERDRRITEIAENYLHGYGIYMLSAGLRGPVEGNPWKTRKRKRLGTAAGNSGGGCANRQKDGRIVDFFSVGKIACGRASSEKRNFVTTAAAATATRSSSEDHHSPITRNTAQPERSPIRRRLPSPTDIRVASSPFPQTQTQTQSKRKRELEARVENGGEIGVGGENDVPMVIDWKKKRPKIDFSTLSPMVLTKCQKENTKGKGKEKERPGGKPGRKAKKDSEKDGVYVGKRGRSVSVSEREVQTEVEEKITRKTGVRPNESPTETVHIAGDPGEAGPSGSVGEQKDTEEGGSVRENGTTALQGKSTRAVQTEKEATGAKPAEPPTEGVLSVSTGGGGNTNNGGEMKDAVLQPTGESISPPVEDTIRSSPASREPPPPEQVTISSPKPVEPLTSPKPARTPIHPVAAAPYQDPSVIREAEQIRSQVISTYIQNMAAQPETPYAWQSTQAQFLAAQDGFFNALADSPIRFPYITPENRRKSQLSDDDTPDLTWGILPYAMIPHPPRQSVPSTVGKLRSSTAPPPTASRFIPPPPPKTPGSIVRAAPVTHPLPPPPPATPLNTGSSLAVPSTSELTPFGAFASPTPSKPRSDHAYQPAQPLLSLHYENTPSKPSSPPPLPSPDNTVSEMMDIIGRDVWDIDEELKKLARNSTPSTTNTSAIGRKEMRAGRNLM